MNGFAWNSIFSSSTKTVRPVKFTCRLNNFCTSTFFYIFVHTWVHIPILCLCRTLIFRVFVCAVIMLSTQTHVTKTELYFGTFRFPMPEMEVWSSREFVSFPCPGNSALIEYGTSFAFFVVKQLGHEAFHSLPCSNQVKNVWSCTSIPL
jgi:hypothetical protein